MTDQSPTDEEVRSLTAEAEPGNATPEPRLVNSKDFFLSSPFNKWLCYLVCLCHVCVCQARTVDFSGIASPCVVFFSVFN